MTTRFLPAPPQFAGSLYKVSLAETPFARCKTLFDVGRVQDGFLENMVHSVTKRDQTEGRVDDDSDYTVYALHNQILYLLTGKVGSELTQQFVDQTPKLTWPEFIEQHIESFAQTRHQGGLSHSLDYRA